MCFARFCTSNFGILARGIEFRSFPSLVCRFRSRFTCWKSALWQCFSKRSFWCCQLVFYGVACSKWFQWQALWNCAWTEFFKARNNSVGKAVINSKPKPWVWQLTKHSRGIHNAWQFWFESALVFTAQWFSLGGMRCSPLNAALCDRAKFLGFLTFVVFDHSFFGVGKSALSTQILESLKP